MRIAYLITAYNNYDHLKRLVDALNDSKNPVFFIHIDKKSHMPDCFCEYNNIKFVRRRKVWWGGWSHLEAILTLLKEALKVKFDYYVLLSGVDYPIRPNNFLYSQLANGGEYINLIKGFQPHKSESRIKYFHFDNFDRRNKKSYRTKFFSFIEKKLRKFYIRKVYPFAEIYHGSTWWALSHDTLAYIDKFIKENPRYVKFFKSSWCPEESFIPTILGNSDLEFSYHNNLTFTDWNSNPAPALIGESHLVLFSNQEEFDSVYGKYTPFFARKFNDDSLDIINKIEAQLR